MKSKNATAVLLLGCNSGDCVQNILNALILLEKRVGKIIKSSSLFETSPWGFADQPEFLNQAVIIETLLQPLKLLEVLKNLEIEMGRITTEKWKQRCIDIDILFYDASVFESEELIIPHPHLHNRKFALIPLLEIMPEFTHPVIKKKIKELTDNCHQCHGSGVIPSVRAECSRLRENISRL